MASENAIASIETEIIQFKDQVDRERFMIERDSDLTHEARSRKMQYLRDVAQAKHQELRQKYFNTVASERKRLLDGAFGLGRSIGFASEAEMRQIRSQYTRALGEAQSMSQGQMMQAIQNAKLAGDLITARAIAAAAWQAGSGLSLNSQIREAAGYEPGGIYGVLEYYKQNFDREYVEQLENFEAAYGDRRNPEMKMREKMILGRPL